MNHPLLNKLYNLQSDLKLQIAILLILIILFTTLFPFLKTPIWLSSPTVTLLVTITVFRIYTFFQQRLSSAQQLHELTHLPLISKLPHKTNTSYQLENTISLKAPFSENLRSLRYTIQHQLTSKKSHIILVTSMVSGEGKSTISANLAHLFQMAQHKTILINLDLRQPTLHNFFGINNEKGMSGFLQTRDTVSEIIFKTDFQGLHIIPAGETPNNPSELILSERLPKLLEILQERYKYIIIDTAPMGLVSDALPIMNYADINLVVMRENYSHKESILELNNMIKNNNLPNIKLVLNDTKQKTAQSYGYTY